METKGSILYVDDEIENLEYFSHILTDDGFQIYTATNCEEAFKKLNNNAPDILLLDVGLRNESGLDILKTVKNDDNFLYMVVLMISGMYKESDQQAHSFELGADGYFTRPIQKREFLARVNSYMRYKSAVSALERSEARFKKIIDRNPDAILIVEQEGQIKFANAAAENLFQLSVDVLLNRLFGYPLIVGDHAEINIFRKTMDDVIGEMRTIDIDWDNKETFLTSIRDISEKKKLWEDLLNAKTKAEESERLKSAFLANMSHEIRTPMNGILGFAELLQKSDLSDQDQKMYLAIIKKSGERMLNIINNIVDISKIEAGQMDVVLKETEINELVQYIYTFFKPECVKKGLTLISHPQYPNQDIVVISDREKLYAIFTNLVKNAIKYSDSGTIEFGYVRKSENIEFFVHDTGIGIPADRQEAIFERFIQADIEDTRAFQGAGLGLAISKAYVEMLGGKLWVQSSINHGSSFFFTIPCQQPHAETVSTSDAFDGTDIKLPQKTLSVLIAEDDKASLHLLEIAMKPFSRKILAAGNGNQAVELCKQNPDLDLLLLDIQMPGLNGFETVKLIREFNSQLVIIAQTAHALTGVKERVLDAGFTDYITKPINNSELLKMLQKYFPK